MTEPMAPVEQRTPTEQQQQVFEVAAQLNDPDAEDITISRVFLPRITIKYCTQCKWMLRAAYFAQELLSTFHTGLGEVALIPATGGVFVITIFHPSPENFSTQETVLWDRKILGGFPEVKQLKSLVRNIVDPSRDLGHVDRALGKAHKCTESTTATAVVESGVNTDVPTVESTSSASCSTKPAFARTVATNADTQMETETSETGQSVESSKGPETMDGQKVSCEH